MFSGTMSVNAFAEMVDTYGDYPCDLKVCHVYGIDPFYWGA